MKKEWLLLAFLTACAPQTDDAPTGYVEGDYVFVSASAGGVLDAVSVKKGQTVSAGAPLFSVDKAIWDAKIARAKAEIDRLNARLSDLSKGKRTEELAVISKQKEQAQAAMAQAEKDFARSQKLLNSGNTTQAAFDKAQTALKTAKARLAEIEADYKTALLPARNDELRMAQAELSAAEQELATVELQAKRNAPAAAIGGFVDDVYFRAGETVGAGVPVVSILPPENVKVRFYVPENRLTAFKVGTKVLVSCDSCSADKTAEINFVSSKAEFTPPVIYSVESRQKLMFMVEAAFENPSDALSVGTPVSVKVRP